MLDVVPQNYVLEVRQVAYILYVQSHERQQSDQSCISGDSVGFGRVQALPINEHRTQDNTMILGILGSDRAK